MVVMPGTTLKATELLDTPLATTSNVPGPGWGPVGTGTVMLVLLKAVGVAAIPLNVTDGELPKLVPVMVTDVPAVPEPGDIELIEGTTVSTGAGEAVCVSVPPPAVVVPVTVSE